VATQPSRRYILNFGQHFPAPLPSHKSHTSAPKMPTAVSAPGKVLLAGGYLVLDRTYTGLVFGLSARIHVLVHDIASSSGVEISEIIVHSPQFQAASWNYGYNLVKDQGGVHITQLQGYEHFSFAGRLNSLPPPFISSSRGTTRGEVSL
jgi:hypothetical protein